MILDRKSLLDRLKIANDRVTSVAAVSTAFKSFRFFTDNDNLYIEASDIERGIRALIRNVEEIEPCDFLVDADKLYKVIGNMKGDVVRFKVTDKHLEVSCAGDIIKFTLNKDLDDFPVLPMYPKDEAFEVGEEFVWKLRSVSFGVASEGTRVAFTGVNIETLDANTLRFATVDETRISVNILKTLTPIKSMFNILVPIKLIEQFVSYRRGGVMNLAFVNNRFIIKADDIMFYTGIYADKFPSVLAQLKRDADEIITFNSKDADNAANLAQVFARNNSGRENFIRFTTEGDEGVFSVESEEGGGSTRFSVTGNTASNHGVSVDKLRQNLTLAPILQIGFNQKRGKDSHWHFMSPDDPDWLSIIMPMNMK